MQRLMAQAVMRPLTDQERTQPKWGDGRATADVAAGFIKPNDRLTSFDRLEIYNRQYWFRLLDCLYEDYPGLRAVLGDKRFAELATAYLEKYPSTSPALRDLGRQLEKFLTEEPGWAGQHQGIALDTVRVEWAQVVAFDAASRRASTLKRLAGIPPDRIFLRLQPYITLLALRYPVDNLVIRLLRQDGKMRSEASNAVESNHRPRQRSRAGAIKKAPGWLLIHRLDNAVYFKRITRPQYEILAALNRGASLAAAFATLEDLPEAAELSPTEVQGWFQSWASLGFLVPAG
ncbi:hypothetical protein BH09VER1_BH09VER1_38670 [soil metagenome]